MIEQKIKQFESQLCDIRHQIHQHPEMGLEEIETSNLVASKLTEWGYQVQRGMAKTGVIGTLKVGNGSKTLGIRADMDALPIHEASGKPWTSKIPNRMHACGHDGHTTMLLGAAKYLAETRNFNGTLHLIFQPAEEMINGGEMMVKEGCSNSFPAMPFLPCTICPAIRQVNSISSTDHLWPQWTSLSLPSTAAVVTGRCRIKLSTLF
ncbi:Uncharacterized hydrolase YxeP [Budvicia aquatica]|uniref:Uncharacterized hydrolase YxeP n=1 Tax=Budvicia aquatica TaxID=82979 RepID=A0A484ZL60_9GAMM|nr:Uncharacterized hydrolase YxeP [Budvicia aquatica]